MDNNKTPLAHILLVEDNDGDIVLTLEAFEECNVKSNISVVKNGADALDFLFQKGAFSDAKKPDLVLLDINIPIFSGHEVLQKIKADPLLKKIPVVMLTTSFSELDLNKAYENHCNSYVRKPLEMSEFINAILKIEQFWLHLTVFPK